MRFHSKLTSSPNVRSWGDCLKILGIILPLFCVVLGSTPACAQLADNDIIKLPPATVKQLKGIIAQAPFQCAFSVGIKHKDSYTAYNFGYRGTMKSASLIKVPFVLELYRFFQEGWLDPETGVLISSSDVVPDGGVLPLFGVGREFSLRELARLTIIPSDCTAANAILRHVGKDNVNALCQKMDWKDTVCEGAFYEKRYNNRTNRMTARDGVEMLRALDSGDVLEEPWRTEVLEMMNRQWYMEKFLGELPADTWYAGKVGEVDGVRNDLEFITKGDIHLYLCGLTANVAQSSQGDRTLSRLARIVYDALP